MVLTYSQKTAPVLKESDHPMGHIAGPEVVGSRFSVICCSQVHVAISPSAPVRLHTLLLYLSSMPKGLSVCCSSDTSKLPGTCHSPCFRGTIGTTWHMQPQGGQCTLPPNLQITLCQTHRTVPVSKQATRSRPNLRVVTVTLVSPST